MEQRPRRDRESPRGAGAPGGPTTGIALATRTGMAAPSSRPWRVLVVDDQASVRRALASLLATDRVEVATAASAAEADARLADGPVDLLVTDLRLAGPGDLGGFEVVRRARSALPRLPILLFSAFADEELRAEARSLGALDLWPKSLPIPELLDRLRELGLPLARPAGDAGPGDPPPRRG